MRRLGCGHAVLAALGMLQLGLALPARAAGVIYAFVDEHGVAHFTNIKKDDRYLPVITNPAPPAGEVEVPQYWGYDGLIGLTAREHQVSPALVKAVIAAESNFDAQAVSRKGAQGLMQLMPATARALGVQDPFSAHQNVSGGTRYLRAMLDRFGDLKRALAAYNAGPEVVDRFRGVPPFRETQDYVQRVLTYYRHYHGDFSH